MFFCVSIHDPVTLDPQNWHTRRLIINCYADFEFQFSKFYRLLLISKSILISQNLRTKPMVLRARAKSLLT